MKKSYGVKAAWKVAAYEAVRSRFQFIEREHLLLGSCGLGKAQVLEPAASDQKKTAQKALEAERIAVEQVFLRSGLSTTKVRQALRERLERGSHVYEEGAVVHRSPACKGYFARADAIARGHQLHTVTCFHLLAALLENPGAVITAVLTQTGMNALRRHVDEVLQRNGSEQGAAMLEEDGTPYLDRYGRDLTALAEEGAFGPLIGRDEELGRIVRALEDKDPRHPVLVGENGVGKSAIIEELARRILGGAVLQERRLVALDLATLSKSSDTPVVFSERLKRMVDEACAHPEVILFFDDLYLMPGAGGTHENAASPWRFSAALARQAFSWIGAITPYAFHHVIEQEAELAQHVHPISVVEPGPEEALIVLQGLKDALEARLNVVFAPGALQAAIDLTVRHVPDRHLPANAIEVLEKAGADLPPALLDSSTDDEAPTPKKLITKADVAHIVAGELDLPAEQLLAEQDAIDLQVLEAALNQRVIGQAAAVARVAAQIRHARMGLGDPHRPPGVFLLLGPTGVGKAMLARAVAETLFGDVSRLIRIDLSMRPHEQAHDRIIGTLTARPHLHNDTGLASRLRAQPDSVVLLDGVEHAPPAVLALLEQIFRTGCIVDTRHRTVVARHAVFMMAADLPLDPPPERRPERTGRHASYYMVQTHFGSSFLKQVDEEVVFYPLTHTHLEAIAARHLDRLKQRIAREHKIDVAFSPEVLALLAADSYDDPAGAHAVIRLIKDRIEHLLARQLQDEAIQTYDRVRLQPAEDGEGFVCIKLPPITLTPGIQPGSS